MHFARAAFTGRVDSFKKFLLLLRILLHLIQVLSILCSFSHVNSDSLISIGLYNTIQKKTLVNITFTILLQLKLITIYCSVKFTSALLPHEKLFLPSPRTRRRNKTPSFCCLKKIIFWKSCILVTAFFDTSTMQYKITILSAAFRNI